MSLLRGWRPALRIARRDAWQHKGRSVVVLVMVALPVLAIVALDTLARTADVSAVEGLDRNLGASDAQVQYSGARRIDQEPTTGLYNTPGGSPGGDDPADPGPVRRLTTLLPQDGRIIEVRRGTTFVKTHIGQIFADAIELDTSDPMTIGLFRVRAGRKPHAANEVAVTEPLAARGYRPGSRMMLVDGSQRLVVGLVDWNSLDTGSKLVVGWPHALNMAPSDTSRSWLVDTPRPMGWAAVKALNHHGFAAVSRAVVTNPPPRSEVDLPDYGSGMDAATIAVIGLVVAMALLEVVLLAGPAFAVGIRRQQRSLALLTATGGQPRDVRRVVLGGGLVLGGVASAVGVVGGIAVARAAQPGAQRFSSTLFGPFEVSARDVLLIAGFGLLSAVLAAVVPAFAAARLDVVAVLAGRRGQTRAPLWSPVLGAVLLAAGVAITVLGATRPAGGETLIAGGAMPAVIGMVLLIPLVVSQLGRPARWLPLPARFAVRDAARHRGRTAPAVAAVAATVSGVVALGIGGASDAAQNKALYTPRGPVGAAVVMLDTGRPADWTTAEHVVTRRLPGAHMTRLLGVPPGSDSTDTLDVEPVYRAGADSQGPAWSTRFGASVLVGADTFHAMGLQLPSAMRDRADTALASGKVVVFAGTDITSAVTSAYVRRQHTPSDGNGDSTTVRRLTVPAVGITAPGTDQPAAAVVPRSMLARTGLAPATTALLVDDVDISTSDEDAINEALQGIDDSASATVERGFHDSTFAVTMLLLGCAGGVLVLGGTLTATFLALSDARADFATMGAVGAAPRTRRTVAASYAATIGLVGAVLGAAIGFVPGIAVSYPLTSAYWAEGAIGTDGAPIASHFLDVPWLLVGGLVVGLPVLVALLVGLASRSRLPTVSRLP